MLVKLNNKYYFARKSGNKTYLHRNLINYLLYIASPSLSVIYQIEHGEL